MRDSTQEIYVPTMQRVLHGGAPLWTRDATGLGAPNGHFRVVARYEAGKFSHVGPDQVMFTVDGGPSTMLATGAPTTGDLEHREYPHHEAP